MKSILAIQITILSCLVCFAQEANRPKEIGGFIVISPNSSPGTQAASQKSDTADVKAKVEADPSRPGFLVIRPNGANYTPHIAQASTGLSIGMPSNDSQNHYGSMTIIRPKHDGMISPVAPFQSTNSTSLPMAGQNATSKPLINQNLLPRPTSQNISTQVPAGQQPSFDKMPDESKGKLTYETWDAVFVKNMHIGFVRTTIREFEKDGVKYLYGMKEMKQTVKRNGQRVEQSEEETTFETLEGKVLVYRHKQGIGGKLTLATTGVVDGKNIVVKGEGAAAGMNDTIPWPDDVIGISKEATIMKGREFKAGETFTYRMFAGQVNWVAKYTVTMKAIDKLAIYQGDQSKDYYKVEVAMEPIRDKSGEVFALPSTTVWHDPATGYPVKAEFDMPPLGGMMSLTRTTREAAMRVPGEVPELFAVQSIKLNKPIPNVHVESMVTYHITSPKGAKASVLFAKDYRQVVQNETADGQECDLTVYSGERKDENAKQPTEEYLKECLGKSFYIDWDNTETKQLAQNAVRALPADATQLQKAIAVEVYVRNSMKAAEFSQAMTPCNTVAKQLSGDCTEYSMLACGMCRSLGIPARTILGVVYAPDKSGNPYLAFHMWFEVYADNRWTSLDSTLAMGKISPGHVKISDVNWHNETSMNPLLPVLRVLISKPTIEVKKIGN